MAHAGAADATPPAWIAPPVGLIVDSVEAGGAAERAEHLAGMPPKGLAILSAKENGFAAGADIDEFTTISSAEQAMAFTTLGNVIFDKIAALPFPTLAMIHGFCVGGAFMQLLGDQVKDCGIENDCLLVCPFEGRLAACDDVLGYR